MTDLKYLFIGGLAFVAALGAHGQARAEPPHYILVSFSLPPGGSKSIPLPADQTPILVVVSKAPEKDGTPTPSERMTAVVNSEPSSHQLTWIGTGSSGDQAGGTTLSNPLIATINGGTDNLVAQPPGPDAPHGALVVSQSAARSTKETYYVVTLIY